jgi:hypothetical protein
VQKLSAADFVVREDNVTREVSEAMLATDPVSVALLVDTTRPVPGAPVGPITQDMRKALQTFVKTLKVESPVAEVSYTEYAGAAVTKIPFTRDTRELQKLFTRWYPDLSGTGVLLEALVDAGARLAKTPAPRRAIVTIDFRSPESSGEHQQIPAINAVERSGATVWAITVAGRAGPTTLAGSRDSSPIRELVLNTVTQRMGGFRDIIIDTRSLESRLKRIAYTLVSQYEITYIRPEAVTSVTDIEVGTKRGVKILKSRWMR